MLDLFVSKTCPYCIKVMNFFNDNKIDYAAFDINYEQNLKKLMTLGGLEQVPFLFDEANNIRMYESDRIIDYAKNLNK